VEQAGLSPPPFAKDWFGVASMAIAISAMAKDPNIHEIRLNVFSIVPFF
jgi:hypothetical protein